MKPGTASAPTPRRWDQVREQICPRHCSRSTVKTYLHWVKFLSARMVGAGNPLGSGLRELTNTHYTFHSISRRFHGG
jgi:hypothetical protein